MLFWTYKAVFVITLVVYTFSFCYNECIQTNLIFGKLYKSIGRKTIGPLNWQPAA